MTAGLGDKLAAGAQSAQFSVQNEYTEFEHNFTFMLQKELCEKYALSEHEYTSYKEDRDKGVPLPDLQPVGQELTVDFEVNDRRFKETMPDAVDTASKFPAKKYGVPTPILDRVLIKRVLIDPDLEELEDGSARSKKTGLVIAAKYRQHSNTGIVLAAGGAVIMGGVRMAVSEFLEPGDRVSFGDYNSEMYPLDYERAKALCDAVQVDHKESDDPLRIVRVQDIRLVEKRVYGE